MATNNEERPADPLQAPESEDGIVIPASTQDAIRHSWNVSLDTLYANLSHNNQEAIDTFIGCFRWCIDREHPMPLPEFARRINSHDTTVRRIMQGKYFTPDSKERQPISAEMLRAMQAFLRVEGERASAKRIGFVETPTVKRIYTACDLARESQSPVFLIGPSHVGKTWALKEYAENHNHGRTIYVRLHAASGLGGMVKLIAAAGGWSDRSNTAALTNRIKESLRPNMLLILDEVHQLVYTYRKESFFACLEVIREIYDESACGLVLCGTQILLKRIQDDRGELEQLLRRGVHKRILPDQPLAADVAAIAKAAGLEMPAKQAVCQVKMGRETLTERPYEMLRQIGKVEGLKAITERLRYGQKLANKAGEPIAWEHVVKAHFIVRQAEVPENDWE